MPPYTPVVSKAQSRKLFELVKVGQMSLADAKGKTKAANWSKLPQHVQAPKAAKPKLPAHVKAAGHPAQNLGRHLHKPGGAL